MISLFNKLGSLNHFVTLERAVAWLVALVVASVGDSVSDLVGDLVGALVGVARLALRVHLSAV